MSAASYLGRILRGEKPADMPAWQATRLELVIDLNAAKALGSAFEHKLLALAREVLEGLDEQFDVS